MAVRVVPSATSICQAPVKAGLSALRIASVGAWEPTARRGSNQPNVCSWSMTVQRAGLFGSFAACGSGTVVVESDLYQASAFRSACTPVGPMRMKGRPAASKIVRTFLLRLAMSTSGARVSAISTVIPRSAGDSVSRIGWTGFVPGSCANAVSTDTAHANTVSRAKSLLWYDIGSLSHGSAGDQHWGGDRRRQARQRLLIDEKHVRAGRRDRLIGGHGHGQRVVVGHGERQHDAALVAIHIMGDGGAADQ